MSKTQKKSLLTPNISFQPFFPLFLLKKEAGYGAAPREKSLHRNALCEVSRFVYVAAAVYGGVVGIGLNRNYRDDGHEKSVGLGELYRIVIEILTLCKPLGAEEHDLTAARLAPP